MSREADSRAGGRAAIFMWNRRRPARRGDVAPRLIVEGRLHLANENCDARIRVPVGLPPATVPDITRKHTRLRRIGRAQRSGQPAG